MKVDALQLWQAVKNVSLFTKKGGWAEAVEVHHHYDGYLRFRTSDDFVGIQSTVQVGTKSQLQDFHLSPQDFKELEKSLRAVKGEVEVFLIENQLHIDPLITSFQTIECPDLDWWPMFTYVMDHTFVFPEARTTFDIGGDRMTQLSRLEPKSDYPVSFGHCSVGDKKTTAFRYGPTTTGMIMDLDREKLAEVYGDRLGDVVWS